MAAPKHRFRHRFRSRVAGNLSPGPWPTYLAIREAMQGKAEQDPRRERIGIRNQAGRSDNTASRACRFEVSAEQSTGNGLFLAEIRNPL